jgi:hypothetical protein
MVTTEDWSFKDCKDYLVELEMATSGAIMSLRLANNDFNSSQADHQITCLSARAREARILAFELRQKHLVVELRNVSPSVQVHGSLDLKDTGSQGALCSLLQGTRSDNLGGLHPRDQGCPRFFGRLEDLGKLKVVWEDYVVKHMPMSLRGSLSSCYIMRSPGAQA